VLTTRTAQCGDGVGDAAVQVATCQAWGGPRALKQRRSLEASSGLANDHDKSRIIDVGETGAGETGNTSVFAKLMLLQTAQKSCARRVGGCGAGGDGAPVEPFVESADAVSAAEMTPTLLR
jgi:hypothetical protein